MQGVCKYCGKEKNLIKSHIIPKSFYQIKKWGQISGIDAKKITLDKVHNQNGWKEPLLCAECDNRLGFLDKQAYHFLFEEVPLKEATQDDLLFRYHFEKN